MEKMWAQALARLNRWVTSCEVPAFSGLQQASFLWGSSWCPMGL